ncbi:TetR/AcrR family transcriptional regulator [Streptomyces sp. NPDC020996]|uniref:TetR/AcrR family transcriptional regulator n=1 Tax=Streptomyces sp. NPDC020996 TaxID=3154791 RepID=UPI0034110811
MADRAQQITDAARELLETEGPDGLSMRRIAERVGIRAPSLYKHFPDKGAVEAALQAQGMAQLAQDLEAAEAGADEGTAMPALARAYRQHALANPHLYRITHTRPLARTALPEGLEERAAMPLVRAAHGDVGIARTLWAFAHGMAVLELDGRFPPGADLDAAWRIGCAALTRAVDDERQGDTA